MCALNDAMPAEIGICYANDAIEILLICKWLSFAHRLSSIEAASSAPSYTCVESRAFIDEALLLADADQLML